MVKRRFQSTYVFYYHACTTYFNKNLVSTVGDPRLGTYGPARPLRKLKLKKNSLGPHGNFQHTATMITSRTWLDRGGIKLSQKTNLK